MNHKKIKKSPKYSKLKKKITQKVANEAKNNLPKRKFGKYCKI